MNEDDIVILILFGSALAMMLGLALVHAFTGALA